MGTGGPGARTLGHLHSVPGMSAADFWFSGFVFRSVVTVPYGHEPDSHSLKINVHAYFRRETSGIQNIVFAPKLIPHSHLFLGGGALLAAPQAQGTS